MKKILAIAPYSFLPAQSGGQKGVFFFYKYLVKNAKVICVSTQNNNLSYSSGIEVLPLLSNSPLRYINIFYFFKLKNIIAKNDIDTIIIEHPYMGWLGILLSLYCKKKLVVHSHNIEALRFKGLKKWWWRILFFYEKRVHRMANFSFFITKEDRDFAIQNFGLKTATTAVITYGTEIALPLSEIEKTNATTSIKADYNIPVHHTVLLFNGVFGYRPNDEALYLLVKKIMPQLLLLDSDFTLIICGKNIPEDIKAMASSNILIKGFVPDIDAVFRGADIFLNPIWQGGGIKTKLVEALALGAAAVSFKSGAIGVPPQCIDTKLIAVADEDVLLFCQAIIRQKSALPLATPQSFYQHFYWGNIARKACAEL